MFSVKPDIDVSTIGKATIVYGYEYNVWCENAKGERTGYNTNGNKGQNTVSGDKLEGWASEHSGLMKFGFDYTADGNIVNTGWK